jgi:hypothetical protein
MVLMTSRHSCESVVSVIISQEPKYVEIFISNPQPVYVKGLSSKLCPYVHLLQGQIKVVMAFVLATATIAA